MEKSLTPQKIGKVALKAIDGNKVMILLSELFKKFQVMQEKTRVFYEFIVQILSRLTNSIVKEWDKMGII